MDVNSIIVLIVLMYFSAGLVALVMLEITTGRITRQMDSASRETQVSFINAGQFVGNRLVIAIVTFALWLFWPVALYGVAERLLKKSNNNNNNNNNSNNNSSNKEE